jgi:tRNA A-37 threonylcarbamoyl transferase component Bud32
VALRAQAKEERVENSSPVTPGDVVLKKYRVERLLGMGAMGIVAEATHLALDQRVAIKFMLPGKDTGGDQYARFIREARASVRLTTPHVTRVFDVGALDSGAPYMVMELLNGRDLDAVLKVRGPLPVDEAAELILQACEALAEAHAIGIVHRDIKPANLFLTRTKTGAPCLKVIDFGISKASNEALKLTQMQEILGSPLYMSPEQMKSSANVDARSDIWSLGATLYELVAGVPPFDAKGIQELCAKVWFEPPTPLATRRPDVPASFAQIVERCLEKDRDRRWNSVVGLAAALAPHAPPRAAEYVERVAAALGEHAEAARPTIELTPALPQRGDLGRSGTSKLGALSIDGGTARPKQRAGAVLAMLVLAMVVLAAAGVMWWRTKKAPEPIALSAVPAQSTPPGGSSAEVPAPPDPRRERDQPRPAGTVTVEPTTIAAPSATVPPVANTTKGTGKDTPSTRTAPAKPPVPAPPSSQRPQGKSMFDL